jgi:hypothetical protein
MEEKPKNDNFIPKIKTELKKLGSVSPLAPLYSVEKI